jgi:NTE family protein
MRLVTRGSYERTLRGIAPLHRRPRLGGAFRLSGVSANELSGQQALLFGVDLYAPLGTPILDTYAGVSIGYGDVSDDERFDWDGLRFSGNVWAGADLPLGPLYLGYGVTEDGGDVFFISLGRPL